MNERTGEMTSQAAASRIQYTIVKTAKHLRSVMYSVLGLMLAMCCSILADMQSLVNVYKFCVHVY